MRLEEMMRAATDDTVADLDRLTRGASTQGRGIRRRRRLAGAVTGVGVVAACAVGVSLITATDPPAPAPAATGSETTGPETTGPAAGTAVEPAPPVPLDGRSTAALLRAMVDDVADGAVDGFAGQGSPGDGSPDTYAELVLAPTGEVGSGLVGVNVQDVAIIDGDPRTCLGFMTECSVVKLPGGDVLRTYRGPSESAAGNDVRRVAELISDARGVRVVVSATNGFSLGGNKWDVTRDASVLTADQLGTLATDERWAFDVPAEYAEQGAGLAPYRDLDNDVTVSPQKDAEPRAK